MNEQITHYKKMAAEKAVEFIKSGMVIGLGEGSTSIFAIQKIGELCTSGALIDIMGIACSRKVEEVARQCGIPLTTLNDNPIIDITIDGADEVDPHFNLIKGGGGALLREKIVAQASKREIIVVDESKTSDQLGTLWPLPIEVTPFGWEAQSPFLESLGGNPIMRKNNEGSPYMTDQSNYIIDCDFGPIKNSSELSVVLNARAGVVEHGLFIDLATDIIIAGKDGVQHLKK